jgi:hypothetical protein
MKELSKISKDEHGFHFTSEWEGSEKIELELNIAREKCSIRAIDLFWTIGQSESNWISVINCLDATKITKYQEYLLSTGWVLKGKDLE